MLCLREEGKEEKERGKFSATALLIGAQDTRKGTRHVHAGIFRKVRPGAEGEGAPGCRGREGGK